MNAKITQLLECINGIDYSLNIDSLNIDSLTTKEL